LVQRLLGRFVVENIVNLFDFKMTGDNSSSQIVHVGSWNIVESGFHPYGGVNVVNDGEIIMHERSDINLESGTLVNNKNASITFDSDSEVQAKIFVNEGHLYLAQDATGVRTRTMMKGNFEQRESGIIRLNVFSMDDVGIILFEVQGDVMLDGILNVDVHTNEMKDTTVKIIDTSPFFV